MPGVPDHIVAAWHGHDEVVMRQTYSHAHLEQLKDAGGALSFRRHVHGQQGGIEAAPPPQPRFVDSAQPWAYSGPFRGKEAPSNVHKLRCPGEDVVHFACTK